MNRREFLLTGLKTAVLLTITRIVPEQATQPQTTAAGGKIPGALPMGLYDHSIPDRLRKSKRRSSRHI